MANQEFMLTTFDNPFNPHTQFDEWTSWDERAGYFTTSFLARLIHSSHELSVKDQEKIIDEAIDKIVSEDDLGIYTRIYRYDLTPLQRD